MISSDNSRIEGSEPLLEAPVVEAPVASFPTLPGAGGSTGNGGAAIELSGAGNSVYNDGVIRGGDAGSATAQAGAGILTSADAVVNEVVNLGRISGGVGLNSYGIVNGGRLVRLVNAQGGTATGATPLTFFGVLPQRYEIVVNSPTSYGQLAVGGVSGTQTMTVSVSTQYGVGFTSGRLLNVITGVEAAQIDNDKVVFGVSDGVLSAITNNVTGAVTDWDLRVLNFGQDLVEPQRLLIDQTSSALRESLDIYDCAVFDEDGLCVSVTARSRSFDGTAGSSEQEYPKTSVALSVSRKFGHSVRAGAFLELGARDGVSRVMNLSNDQPLLGGYAVWDGDGDGTGLLGRIAVASKSEKMRIQRVNLVGSALDAAGSSDLESWGVRGTLGWGYRVSDRLTVVPYVGVARTSVSRSGYAEAAQAGVVDAAFTFDRYRVKQSTTLAGLQLRGALSSAVNYRLGAELEQDDSYDIDRFRLSGLFGSASYLSALVPEKNRTNFSVGLDYQYATDVSLSLDVLSRQFVIDDASDQAVLLSVKIGL
jgi:hypothetical protein